MGIGQSSYDMKMSAAIAGMLADNGDHHSEAFIMDEEIGFGLGVVKGAISDGYNASGESVALPDDANGVFRGITVFKHGEHSYPYADGGNKLAAGDVGTVLRRGRVWVQIDGTATVDGTVYITTAGKFTSTQGSNSTATTAVFRRVDTALGLAIVEVNLP